MEMPESERFPVGVAEKLGCYVYLLIDPGTGRPFYVGKGTGERCFAHLREARRTLADEKGDYPKLSAIRAIEATGARVRIELLRHGMTDAEAFAVEAAAIDLLGMPDLHNRVTGAGSLSSGRMGLADIWARYAAEPLVIVDDEPLMLIRVSRAYRRGMSDDELYAITRGFWVVSRSRARSAARVLSVFGGVVRAVYTVDEWVPPTAAEIGEDPRRAGRWGFNGVRDEVGEARYLYHDVTGFLSLGAQNPIRYVNC